MKYLMLSRFDDFQIRDMEFFDSAKEMYNAYLEDDPSYEHEFYSQISHVYFEIERKDLK